MSNCSSYPVIAHILLPFDVVVHEIKPLGLSKEETQNKVVEVFAVFL